MKTPIVVCALATFVLAPMASANFVDRLKARLDRMDADGDGLITLDEFRVPGRKGGMPGDSDGDGSVSVDELNAHLDEREAAQAARVAEHRARLTEHFAQADGDGDGVVTPDEAKAAAFARLDTDKDGGLSPAELREGRKGMRRGKGPRGRHGRRHDRPDW